MTATIRSSVAAAAPAPVVHDLLTDIVAWRVWAPHVASAEPSSGRLRAGDVVRVRAWFSPVATPMRVTRAAPAEGMAWESRGLGHVLRYEQHVEAVGEGSRVTFSAQVDGPAGALLTRLARPLSAFGQRRRLRRLAALAALVAAGQAAPTAAR